MIFFTTKLLLSGKELESSGIIQAPANLQSHDIKQLMNNLITEENDYLIEINNIIYEENLQFMAQKCNLTVEDTIIINCTKCGSETPESTIDLPDVATSFYLYNENLYVSCLNYTTYTYNKGNLAGQQQKSFIIRQFINEDCYFTTEDEVIFNELTLKNINQVVFLDQFIKNKIELITFEKSLKKFDSEIFLYNKNEYLITKNGQIFYKNDLIASLTNEEFLCFCLQTNDCFATTKNVYFLESKIKKERNILKYTDRIVTDENFYALTCVDKWYLFCRNNNRLIKTNQEDGVIMYIELKSNKLVVAVGTKIHFYAIDF